MKDPKDSHVYASDTHDDCVGDQAAGPRPVVLDVSSPVSTAATRSIYDLWTPRQRGVILAVVSISQFLNPFSSSIMLPTLKDIEAAFHASSTAGAAVLALYYFPLGVSSLAWGPACDVWGRKSIYLASTAMYAAATLGCIFAKNLAMLLAFRALQGVALGAYRGAGIGTIADIYPVNQRGLAIGILLLSTLVGPVLGPLLGGFLGQAFGWQAPFFALLVFASGIILPCTLLLVRETHQYLTLKRLDPAVAATIKEAPAILAHPPRFGSLLAPILAVCDRRVILHLLQSTVGFACMLSAQTEMPGQLSQAPYNLSPGMMGVAFMATGGAGMIASPLGGRLYDRVAARSPDPMARLTINNMASLIGMPVGLLVYGWSAQYRAHLALVLIGNAFIGFSMCIYLPAFMGYLSIIKQKQAGSASSGQNTIIFVVTGILVLLGSVITRALGIGLYMTLLAALHVTVAVAASWQIMRVKARQRGIHGLVPEVNHAGARAGGAAAGQAAS